MIDFDLIRAGGIKTDFFDYFQIVVLALFYAAFACRTIQMMSRGINPFVLGKGKKGMQAVLEIAFIFGLIIWTIEIVLAGFHLGIHVFPGVVYTVFIDSLILKSTGAILIISGLLLFIWALISFGNSWRIGIDKDNPGGLITSGVFSFTRNPIFVFIDLYFIGTFFIITNLFFAIFAIAVLAGIHFQILQEEHFLHEHYKSDYKSYAQKVRRYI